MGATVRTLHSFPRGGSAVVVGSSGGIGGALARAVVLSAAFTAVHALSRGGSWQGGPETGIVPGRVDVSDEGSVAAAASAVAARGPVRLVVVASGVLAGPGGEAPEKSYRALDAEVMLHLYRVNAVGPALVAKHFLPLLARPGRSVFAALSARVGSIGDNRLGGWHSYRASKAALNMVLRTLAIELSRRNPDALCVGLHPGTVDTPLSQPFQANVPDGKLFTPEYAAARLLAVLDGLQPEDSGSVLAWDGRTVPP